MIKIKIIIGSLITLMFMSCGTSNLTQRQIEIQYEIDKLRSEYYYKSDSLYIEYYKNNKNK
jgi:hypothetical protein